LLRFIFPPIFEIVGVASDEVIQLLNVASDKVAQILNSPTILLKINLLLKFLFYTMLLEYRDSELCILFFGLIFLLLFSHICKFL